MAGFGRPRVVGRIIVLLLIILALAVGGLVWFDYIGLVNAKSLLSPAYRLLRIPVPKSSAISSDSPYLLDEERFGKRLEALNSRAEELDTRASELARLDAEIGQKAQELEERGKALEDREKSFNDKLKQYDNKRVNVEQNAQYLTGMPPAKAVEIMKTMDDQLVIDVFRSVDGQARAAGEDSIVAYWLSLMPPDRAATLQRKMAIKPGSLDY